MKRSLLLIVALLFAIAMAAQNTNTAGTSAPANVGQAQPAQPAANAHHHHGAANSAKEATLTGCLNGPNAENAYVLTTAKNKKGVEVGMPGSDELSKHVGHKVKLTGTWAKSGEQIGENEKMEKSAGEKEEHGEKHFQVTKIDHLADSCTLGGSADKGPTGDNRGAISNTSTDDKVTKKDQEKQKQQEQEVPK
jgi:hypothetical protein